MINQLTEEEIAQRLRQFEHPTYSELTQSAVKKPPRRAEAESQVHLVPKKSVKKKSKRAA